MVIKQLRFDFRENLDEMPDEMVQLYLNALIARGFANYGKLRRVLDHLQKFEYDKKIPQGVRQEVFDDIWTSALETRAIISLETS